MASPGAMLPPVEAARRLGVTRSRVHALVQQAELDDVVGQALRVTAESVERRLAASTPSPRVHQADSGASAILALTAQPLLLSWVSSLPEVNGAWPSRPVNPTGYCMKCKTQREIKNPKQVTMKNGRPATEGACATCNTKMFKIGAAA